MDKFNNDRVFEIIDSKSKQRIGTKITLSKMVSTFTSCNIKSEIFIDINFESKEYAGELTTQLETDRMTLRLDNIHSKHGNAFLNLEVREISK